MRRTLSLIGIFAAVAAIVTLALPRPAPAANTLIYGMNAIQDLDLTGMGADGVTGPAVIAVGNYRRLFKFHTTDPKYHPSNSHRTAPPDEAYIAAWAREVIVPEIQRYAGQKPLAEIWNEPNLAEEWGGRTPNPAYYAKMLQIIYPIVKAAVPDAVIVTAGLSTVGSDAYLPTAMDDATFLRGIYDNGGKGYFDVVGTHPYGFGRPPEQGGEILSFRRAETQHAILIEKGDPDRQMVATEFGWIRDPAEVGRADCEGDPSWYGRWWQRVSAQTQADYTVRAYQYAYQNWPWMMGMFLFNLDWPTGSNGCDQMGYYAIHGQPAETAFRNMAKPAQAYLPAPTATPTITPTPTRTPTPTATPTPEVIEVVATVGGSFTTSDGTILQFPPNAAARDYDVHYQPVAATTARPNGLDPSQRFFRLAAYTNSGRKVTSFSAPYTLTVPLPEPQRGVVAQGTEHLLRFGNGSWTTSGLTETLLMTGQVRAQTNLLDTFGIFGRANRVFLPGVSRSMTGW